KMPTPNGSSAHSNFPSEANLSYSLATPYYATESGKARYMWKNTLGSEFAVAGDMNPGTPQLLTTGADAGQRQLRLLNSYNHNQGGQNVLFCAGYVAFSQPPFVRFKKDNI